MRFEPSPLSAKRPFLSGKSRPSECNPVVFALSIGRTIAAAAAASHLSTVFTRHALNFPAMAAVI
jgi:hypothetical protein